MSISKRAAWIRIARLQFYPMVVILYSVGAAAAAVRTGHFNWSSFFLTYLCLFLIELATVLTNEYFDVDTDRANKNASPFTGGSRILADGILSPEGVRNGIVVVLVLLVVTVTVLAASLHPMLRGVVVLLLGLGLVLGIGYTAPPLRLCYRGLGEVDVAFTHSVYVIMVGYAAQTGEAGAALPIVLGLPAFFAVLSANTLAGLPDRTADASVDKFSYAVLFGPRTATVIAVVAALLAGLTGVRLWTQGTVGGWIGAFFVLPLAHALYLSWVLVGFYRSSNYDRRIDAIMINALNFIIWFGIIPLVYFLWLVFTL